jgi:hypothetical protein
VVVGVGGCGECKLLQHFGFLFGEFVSVGEGQAVGGVGGLANGGFEIGDGGCGVFGIDEKLAEALADGGIFREFAIKRDGFGFLIRFFVLSSDFEESVFVVGGSELRGGFGEFRLLEQGAAEAEVSIGGCRVGGEDDFVAPGGGGEIAGIEKGLGVEKAGAGIGWFGVQGFFEDDCGVGGELVTEEKNAEIEVCFVEAWLEFEGFAKFGDGFGVFILEAEGEGEVEVGTEVSWFRLNGLAEQGFGCGRLVGVERFEGVGQVVLCEQKNEEERGWACHGFQFSGFGAGRLKPGRTGGSG